MNMPLEIPPHKCCTSAVHPGADPGGARGGSLEPPFSTGGYPDGRGNSNELDSGLTLVPLLLLSNTHSCPILGSFPVSCPTERPDKQLASY